MKKLEEPDSTMNIEESSCCLGDSGHSRALVDGNMHALKL